MAEIIELYVDGGGFEISSERGGRL